MDERFLLLKNQWLNSDDLGICGEANRYIKVIETEIKQQKD